MAMKGYTKEKLIGIIRGIRCIQIGRQQNITVLPNHPVHESSDDELDAMLRCAVYTLAILGVPLEEIEPMD